MSLLQAKNLITTRTRTTITSSQISASMPFFTTGTKDMSHDGNRVKLRVAPSKTKWSEKTWLHVTESYPILQFPNMSFIRDRRRSLPKFNTSARSMKTCIKQIFIMA
jgi:hypothetical protein